MACGQSPVENRGVGARTTGGIRDAGGGNFAATVLAHVPDAFEGSADGTVDSGAVRITHQPQQTWSRSMPGRGARGRAPLPVFLLRKATGKNHRSQANKDRRAATRRKRRSACSRRQGDGVTKAECFLLASPRVDTCGTPFIHLLGLPGSAAIGVRASLSGAHFAGRLWTDSTRTTGSPSRELKKHEQNKARWNFR